MMNTSLPLSLLRPACVPARRHDRGFTLVEMMVAMTLGLLLTLGVCMSMLSMGQQFRNVGASTAAQVNAQVALSLLTDAGRNAGAGLFNNRQPVCGTLNAWRAGTVKSNGAALMPARITSGGSAGASDTLVFTGASGTGSLSGMPVVDAMGSTTADVLVSAGGLVNQNDLILVGVPGSSSPCTLMQVTAAPTTGTSCAGVSTSCKSLTHTSVANTGYNAPASTFTTEPLYGFTSSGSVVGPAVAMRLGTEFQQQAFAVMCNTLVQYNAFSVTPTCTASPLSFGTNVNALATDVVLMKAQYGISNSATSNVVTSWVDASGTTWSAPAAADVRRIKAVRVVVISRSKEPDSDYVTPATCTNGASVVNTGPCNFEDASAPVIDLSGVAVPSSRHWRQYRYRVQQAVIPLRNVIWSNG